LNSEIFKQIEKAQNQYEEENQEIIQQQIAIGSGGIPGLIASDFSDSRDHDLFSPETAKQRANTKSHFIKHQTGDLGNSTTRKGSHFNPHPGSPSFKSNKKNSLESASKTITFNRGMTQKVPMSSKESKN
jgi:hypothetical protein